MKVFLVSRPEYCLDNDEYESFVVVAETAQDARMIHPDGTNEQVGVNGRRFWVDDPGELIVEELGDAHDDMRPGVVLASRIPPA